MQTGHGQGADGSEDGYRQEMEGSGNDGRDIEAAGFAYGGFSARLVPLLIVL